jgi:hypothetical protein
VLKPTCPIHGDSTAGTDGQVCTCWRITFIVSYSTSTPVDWVKQLQIMRVWKVTLHGRIDGQKQTVPDAFQDAFKDGELEL